MVVWLEATAAGKYAIRYHHFSKVFNINALSSSGVTAAGAEPSHFAGKCQVPSCRNWYPGKDQAKGTKQDIAGT